MRRFFITLAAAFLGIAAFAQNNPLEVKQIELSNGMQVWINRDSSQPIVYGAVVVKAGVERCFDRAAGGFRMVVREDEAAQAVLPIHAVFPLPGNEEGGSGADLFTRTEEGVEVPQAGLHMVSVVFALPG